MASLTLRAHGPATPDEVWERYARPDRWSSWSPQISRVEVEVPRLAEGVTGVVVGPAGLAVDFTVEHWDELGREWSWSVRPALAPRLRLQLGHAVTAEGTGSATQLRISGPLPLVLSYAAPARLALHRLVQE